MYNENIPACSWVARAPRAPRKERNRNTPAESAGRDASASNAQCSAFATPRSHQQPKHRKGNDTIHLMCNGFCNWPPPLQLHFGNATMTLQRQVAGGESGGYRSCIVFGGCW